MAIILPANTLSAGGFNVDNSCRFNDGDSPSFSKTRSTPTSEKKYTCSAWVKFCTFGTNVAIAGWWKNSNSYLEFTKDDDDRLKLDIYEGGSAQWSSTSVELLRDPSAWYHLMFNVDSTDSSAGDRVKIYINGVRTTTFESNTSNVSLNSNVTAGLDDSGTTVTVGASGVSAAGNRYFFDGYIAEFFHIDGLAYAASTFGEFDEDSPTIWKPKDCKDDLTFGNEGFYLDFEDSGNLGDDESSNTDDLAETNLAAVDQCQDSPTNNFATFNPLARNPSDTGSLSEGNCKYSLSSYEYNARSTIGVNSGKWYFEVKIGTYQDRIGIITSNANNNLDTDSLDFYYGSTGKGALAIVYNDGGSTTVTKTINDTSRVQSTATGTQWGAGDIIMCAFDLDNNRIYWGEAGTWYFSADPEDGTGAVSISNSGGDPWHVIAGWGTNSSRSSEWNFGNPSFTISSGNADGNGYGNFEYAVPSGYYALCTKNLAEFG